MFEKVNSGLDTPTKPSAASESKKRKPEQTTNPYDSEEDSVPHLFSELATAFYKVGKICNHLAEELQEEGASDTE